MPEGDTIFRAARTLHRALAGRSVARFESVYPALTRVDVDTPLTGRTVESVTSRGKHLLMAFSGDLVLHTHMRMNGSWHIYRPGEAWRAPARAMRVLVATADYVAVGFNVPVAEFLTARELARHPQIQALGPDLADPLFDRGEVVRRIRACGNDPIEDVLLNQRVISGIGNVLKSEVLFVSGINPLTSANVLTDEALDRLITVALRLMAMNVVESPSGTPGIGRRTTGSLNPNAKLWVYARGGKPCRTCGTIIKVKTAGVDARLTYWCARCQA
jgi:endonuclease VIII